MKPMKRNKFCTCKPCKCNPPCTCQKCADKIKITRISTGDHPSPKMLLLINEEIHKMSNGSHINPKGAKLTITPKKPRSIYLGTDTKLHICSRQQNLEPQADPNNPCICGSPVCDKEIRKLVAKQKTKKKKVKPCVCGSPICKEEMKNLQSSELSPTEKNKNKKPKKKKTKNELLLLERYKKEDEIRRKQRLKLDKYMADKVEKYKDTSDVLLAAESVLDIARLGFTTGIDILRNLYRVVIHPIETYKRLRSSTKDPSRMMVNIENALNDSAAVSTLRRVGARVGAMSGVAAVRNKLGDYPVTHFLMHAGDKDPKRRLQYKKRMKRRKEPIDFKCSLFMSSLRKRPCLSIYYMCPWFYPHCISFLRIWKQFTDIMLFLLAVAVWSPCILAMEICRAMMCCAFCTG
ncbi:uncharacterized protein ACR2FA_004276 [Aphomia sociella]